MTEILIALISALTGGGLTGLIYWRANQRKAEGEATQTEADAMKSIQDVYQQALEDQNKYIAQLRETRDHLVNDREEMRRENNELRKRLNETDQKVLKLERDVTRNSQMVESLRHLLCGRPDCRDRILLELGISKDLNPTEVSEKQQRKIAKKNI